MKKIIFSFCVLLLTYNCSVKEKPEFIGVENIKIQDADNITVYITADAKFNNPNDIGGKLSTESIKVYVNNVEMATLVSKEFKVPAKKNFSIPLEVKIPTDSIISDKSIGGLLGSLLTQKINVQYKGDIKYKVIGFSHRYTIDKTETIKLKL